jgi:UDP-N-acetylmuramate dehydrogenase
MSIAAVRTRPLTRLIDRLPAVRGSYRENVALAPFTWFRVGGPAEVEFRPDDAEDLADFLAAKPAEVPVTVLGVSSNLLVRDGGIPGVVVRLGKGFAGIEFCPGKVRVGAAVLDQNVARAALREARGGLEFLSGIPGSIGGGLRMNAGAYGSELRNVVITAEALDPLGGWHVMTPEEMGMAYRHSGVPVDWIFTAATLRAPDGDADSIGRAMADIETAREASQPIRARTGGSTFANPPGEKAWTLIDAAGCRGLRVGGAMVSEKHCNFLINTGTATAADIERLAEEVRRRVHDVSGHWLRWEIRRIGVPAGAPGPIIEPGVTL